MATYPPAREPEDLDRYFLERANAGDVDGVVALYEPGAVLATPARRGRDALKEYYAELLASRPTFGGEVQPAIRNGELALTSARFTRTVPGPEAQPVGATGATVELARRQTDGSWLWVIDQPNVI